MKEFKPPSRKYEAWYVGFWLMKNILDTRDFFLGRDESLYKLTQTQAFSFIVFLQRQFI